MSEAHDPHKAIDCLLLEAPKFAAAKSQRVYLEQFRKSKKAILMGRSGERTAVMKEAEAYAHPEYLEVLEGLRDAVEVEEALKWKLIAAEAAVEIWRTEQANARAEGRATQ